MAIGLSAGIGAVELAAVISIAFNFAFAALWLSEYGERKGMKRYWPTMTGSTKSRRRPSREKKKA